MFYFLISLSYDGGNYHGWVVQKQVVTIQSTLDQALRKVLKTDQFKTLGASKTDAGVHACDQKVLLTMNFCPLNLNSFQKAINRALPNDLRINSLHQVPEKINFSQAVGLKTYIYTVNDQQWVLTANRYEWLKENEQLDISQLQILCDLFVGEHNFRNFCGLKTPELKKVQLTRTIQSFRVYHNQLGKVEFEIKGPSFLRYQIRMMLASIFKVYEKKYLVQDVVQLLKGEPGVKFPFLVPAHGLCLKEIILK